MDKNKIINDENTCQHCGDKNKIIVSKTDEIGLTVTQVVKELVGRHYQEGSFGHVSQVPLPSRENIIFLIEQARRILFPGYFGLIQTTDLNLEYQIGQGVISFYQSLSKEIEAALRHECLRYGKLDCADCQERGEQISLTMIQKLFLISELLSSDVLATKEGDPAVGKHYDQIIFSYPGLYAVMIYRLAHELWLLGVPFIPRIMTEYAHSQTGIDIHPGAEIGSHFFIDHGTGVVIGETTKIGKGVRIYQGVTLGALSLPHNAGETLAGKKRHPTIEDEVIIYAGATILGGDTVIGARSIIGGNVWLTKGVPPGSKVIIKEPELVIINGDKKKN